MDAYQALRTFGGAHIRGEPGWISLHRAPSYQERKVWIAGGKVLVATGGAVDRQDSIEPCALDLITLPGDGATYLPRPLLVRNVGPGEVGRHLDLGRGVRLSMLSRG